MASCHSESSEYLRNTTVARKLFLTHCPASLPENLSQPCQKKGCDPRENGHFQIHHPAIRNRPSPFLFFLLSLLHHLSNKTHVAPKDEETRLSTNVNKPEFLHYACFTRPTGPWLSSII